MTHPEMWQVSMLLVNSTPLACHPRVVSAFILVSPFGGSTTCVLSAILQMDHILKQRH